MSKSKIKLITNDNKSSEVELDLLEPMKFFKGKENLNEINIDISDNILQKVIEFSKIYIKNKKVLSIPEPLPDGKQLKEIINNDEFYRFIDTSDFENIFELINAGALLEFDSLHDLSCAKIASFMKGKTPEEVNNYFTIECQLTNDEAKELGLEVDAE